MLPVGDAVIERIPCSWLRGFLRIPLLAKEGLAEVVIDYSFLAMGSIHSPRGARYEEIRSNQFADSVSVCDGLRRSKRRYGGGRTS